MNPDSKRRLRTGRTMPVIALGTWELTHETAAAVEEALGRGYRMIDTSGDYGTQPGIGEAVRRSRVPRDEIYLVTKVEEDEDGYDSTRRNLDELQEDHVELMLIHRPPPGGLGRKIWEGLMRAREEGLTRDIGVSNYTIGQIERLTEATGEAPVVNQIEWSPFGWSREMLDFCRQREIVIQAYSPLTRATRLDDGRLRNVADRYDRTPAQILLRWALQLGVVPLPKANQVHHQAENLGAFDFVIDDEDMEEIGAFNEHYSSLGSLAYV